MAHGLLYEVDHEHGYSQSLWPDGSCCTAVWGVTAEDEARALELGYRGPDVCAQMGREHDLLHHIVAQAQGWPWSMVLWAVAKDLTHPPGFGNQEERLVFLLTRTLNLGGLTADALV